MSIYELKFEKNINTKSLNQNKFYDEKIYNSYKNSRKNYSYSEIIGGLLSIFIGFVYLILVGYTIYYYLIVGIRSFENSLEFLCADTSIFLYLVMFLPKFVRCFYNPRLLIYKNNKIIAFFGGQDFEDIDKFKKILEKFKSKELKSIIEKFNLFFVKVQPSYKVFSWLSVFNFLSIFITIVSWGIFKEKLFDLYNGLNLYLKVLLFVNVPFFVLFKILDIFLKKNKECILLVNMQSALNSFFYK